MDEIFLYVHPSSINNNHFYLSKDESHHFLKSLRGSIGDEVWLLDGTGLAFRARVEKIDNFIVAGSIYLFMTFVIHNIIKYLEKRYSFS